MNSEFKGLRKKYDKGNILSAIHITIPYSSGSDQSDSWRETKGIQDRGFKEIIKGNTDGGMNRVKGIH